MRRRVRIGLDARMVEQRFSGLGRYARALVARLPIVDPDSDYVVIHRPEVDPRALLAGDARAVAMEGWLDTPGALRSGPAIERLELDIYHALHHFLPLSLRGPRVCVTLHDLIWVEHAHLSYDHRLAWLRWPVTNAWGRATMWHAMRRADRVLAISGASLEAARRRYGIAAERATVVHHGVTLDQLQPGDVQAPPPGLGPDPERAAFLLCLGNTRPYKNVRAALHALARLPSELARLRLVISGRSDALASLRRLAGELGIAGRVVFTGMVDQHQLGWLYQHAIALVFPSLVEGFGLPVVEAMASGCPVIAADIPVLREIAGDAALAVDPRDPTSIADAAARLSRDPDLRRGLVERGRQRAARFSWERCARQTAEVYRQMVRGP